MNEKLDLGNLEINILKMMQVDRSFLLIMLKNLKRDYFESEIHGKIFMIYETIFNRTNRTPSKDMIEQLLSKNGVSENICKDRINRIFDDSVIDSTEQEYITQEVVSFGKRAKMRNAILNSIGYLENDEFGKINEEVKEALLFNLDVDSGYDLFDIDARYENLMLSYENKITTGYPQFDKVLDGGFARKELYAFMGPPGIGKCSYYNSEIEIEIDTDDPQYNIIKQHFSKHRE